MSFVDTAEEDMLALSTNRGQDREGWRPALLTYPRQRHDLALGSNRANDCGADPPVRARWAQLVLQVETYHRAERGL